MKLRTAILAALLSAQAVPATAGGIPVIDIASITQQIAQVNHMVTQITEMRNQLMTAKAQLESMSGARLFGSLASTGFDAVLEAYPLDTMEIVGINGSVDLSESLALAGEASALSGSLGDLLDQNNTAVVTYLEHSKNILEQAKGRFASIEGMINQISSATEQKDVLDLTARIAGEQVMLQNENIKLLAVMAEAEAQKQIQEQKNIEIRLSALKPTYSNAWAQAYLAGLDSDTGVTE